MKDSKTWWNEVKQDEEKLVKWLKDQYHGEVTAGDRIFDISNLAVYKDVFRSLRKIAAQEYAHANWIKGLLDSRGIPAEVLVKESRYWQQTLPENHMELPLEQLAAIGAHAEAMRLERIRVIAADESAPADIRKVFQNILPQEEFHEETFRNIAGEKAVAEALASHELGVNALGLTI